MLPSLYRGCPDHYANDLQWEHTIFVKLRKQNSLDLPVLLDGQG